MTRLYGRRVEYFQMVRNGPIHDNTLFIFRIVVKFLIECNRRSVLSGIHEYFWKLILLRLLPVLQTVGVRRKDAPRKGSGLARTVASLKNKRKESIDNALAELPADLL